MKTFSDLIIETSIKKNSKLIVGLDPRIELIPSVLKEGLDLNSLTDISKILYEFNKLIIDATESQVVAIKPQLAYYELYGSKGIEALEKTISYAKDKDLLIINDAKRGDIGPTAEAYANALIGNSQISGNAVTVNPFLGSDSINPFISNVKKFNKGIFVLVKTSNPSSSELQDLVLFNDRKLYEHLANYIDSFDDYKDSKYGYSSVGAVVGGTYSEEAKKLRSRMPHTLFLVPGIGAQGGKIDDLTNYFNEDKHGAFISVSREIIFSYQSDYPEKWNDLTIKEIYDSISKKSENLKNKVNFVIS